MVTRTERAIYQGLAITVAVGLVGAVLWPVFANGRPYNYRTSCLTNVKMLGTGLAIYLTDSDEILPYARSVNGPTAVGWGERLFPYVKDRDRFKDSLETGATISYAMNANAVTTPKTASPAAPERTVLLFEIANARPGRGGELHSTLRLSPVGDGAAGGFLDSTDPEIEPIVRPATGPLLNSGLDATSEPRHKGRSIFGFLDSHARAFLPTEVSAGANARRPLTDATPSGCTRPDLPGRSRPCAEGVVGKITATFSFW